MFHAVNKSINQKCHNDPVPPPHHSKLYIENVTHLRAKK